MKKKFAIIINPKSGVERNKKIQEIANEVLASDNTEVSIHYTQAVNDGARLAKELVESGINNIIAVGGDGSINDIIQSVSDKDVTIGIIPKGSGNGLARSLRIPFNVKKAFELIKEGHSEKIDIGMANGKPFISNVGVGFDCKVAEEFSKSNTRGLVAYAMISSKLLWQYRAHRWVVNSDRESKKGRYLLLNVCNIPQFGYNFYTAPRATTSDGKLHILRVKDFPKILGVNLAIYGFLKKINNFPYTRLKSAQEVTITRVDNESFYYQADGDLKEEVSSLHITILPKHTRFFVRGK